MVRRRRRKRKTNRLPKGVYIGNRKRAFLLFSNGGKYLGYSTSRDKVKSAASVIKGEVVEYEKK